MNPTGAKGTTHIFFKTRMCAKYSDGTCRNGANCTFAHGMEDLRSPPPNWQDLVRDGGPKNWSDDQRMIHKMKICRKFYNGDVCPYGQNCNFLHERPTQNTADSGDQCSNSAGYDRPNVAKAMNPNSDALVIQPNQCKWEITPSEQSSAAVPVLDASTGTSIGEEKKLWKKKINTIYGDWIDDEEW